MKKLLLLATLALGVQLGAQNTVYIDSVRVLPQNPTATDSVFLHIWWWSGYSTTPLPPTVASAGNNHAVSACYLVGLAAVVTGGHDSVFVFQGPSGIHTVSWVISQNSSQMTSCDQFVDGNQQQVNVLTTGIGEHNGSSNLVRVQNDFICNTAGTFRVYSTTGQVVYEASAIPGQRISVNPTAGQLYFATLTGSNGEVTTIKFVVE